MSSSQVLAYRFGARQGEGLVDLRRSDAVGTAADGDAACRGGGFRGFVDKGAGGRTERRVAEGEMHHDLPCCAGGVGAGRGSVCGYGWNVTALFGEQHRLAATE